MNVFPSARPRIDRAAHASAWRFAVMLFAHLITVSDARAASSLETYGRLPSIEYVRLCPDGSRLAYARSVGDRRTIDVRSLKDDKQLLNLSTGGAKLRDLQWADDDHLLITTSMTGVPDELLDLEREWLQLLIVDLAHRTVLQIPDGRRFVDDQGRPAQQNVFNTALGRVTVRQIQGRAKLFFETMLLSRPTTLPALIQVDVETEAEHLLLIGPPQSDGWVVDANGRPLASEIYFEDKQRWGLFANRPVEHEQVAGGDAGRGVTAKYKYQQIAGGDASLGFPQLLGPGEAPDTVLMRTAEKGDIVWRPLSLNDSRWGDPIGGGKAFVTPIEDRLTGRLIGGSYWDERERFAFFDPATQLKWQGIVDSFKPEEAAFISASDDLHKVVVRVQGARSGYRYQLVEPDRHPAQILGDVYEGIHEVLEVRPIEYAAGDGLTIPAYLTLPRQSAGHKLPLIVLVHGGPAARDSADFDWWSQALADQGYAVLQANYRGSSVRDSFIGAGFGEFGRKMQSDLSDGVRYLVDQGIVDPARVCIAGASYGGYAALEGATMQPGTYRCAVSVAGLSDLKQFLKWVNRKQGRKNSPALRFWDRFMGVTGPSDPALEQISPIKHVDAVKAPILLIHGKDDTVVPYDQSDDMYDALRHARKTVEFVKLKKEDHWLSNSDTRLQMLQATVEFLKKHNPPD